MDIIAQIAGLIGQFVTQNIVGLVAGLLLSSWLNSKKQGQAGMSGQPGMPNQMNRPGMPNQMNRPGMQGMQGMQGMPNQMNRPGMPNQMNRPGMPGGPQNRNGMF